LVVDPAPPQRFGKVEAERLKRADYLVEHIVMRGSL
jgi:hypothetical protein